MEKVNIIIGKSTDLDTINPSTYYDTIYLFTDKIGAYKIGEIGNLKNAKYRGQLTGASDSRPTDIAKGFQYFDTTLNKPIWWNGSAWVDATGAEV